jgi:hypothetical protein
VNSLNGSIQRFRFERTSKAESLQEIIDEMGEANTDQTGTATI